MSLADSIRRRTDEWVERKRREGRMGELLATYAYLTSDYKTQYLENRG